MQQVFSSSLPHPVLPIVDNILDISQPQQQTVQQAMQCETSVPTMSPPSNTGQVLSEAINVLNNNYDNNFPPWQQQPHVRSQQAPI